MQVKQADFHGQVILPGDAEYDTARTVFYGGIDRRPAAIIRVADVDDVKHAIALAKENNVELAIRSGGHSVAGHSTSEGGLVIDLHDLRQLDIDPETQTAWVGAGLTAGEITTAADAHDLVIGFGDTGSVGVGGITLGGGVGFLSRKYGLTIDNLLAADIVTADGQVLQIDQTTYPDLFWAIRGGGGNFGVVTRFKFQLHRESQVLGGMLILPATPEVITGFIKEASQAPEELSTILNIMPSPPMPFVPAEYHGKLIAMALVMYAGDPARGQEVVAPLRALAPPITDQVRPMRYKDIFFPENKSYHPTAVAQTLFMQEVNLTHATTIMQQLAASEAAMRAVQLRVLGGAVSRVAEGDTAFAHRRQPIMANVAAFYEGSADRAQREAWVMNLAKELDQAGGAAYVNFVGDEGADRVRDAYPPATWERLTVIKRQYDPTNLFRLNQNIPPE